MFPVENKYNFLARLQKETETFKSLISINDGEWAVKGFIDVFRNVYAVSGDTKVISKLIEIMLFPYFVNFAKKYNYKLVIARQQNHYPDLTFIDDDNCKFAVDLKSTYRINKSKVNTMTLGAFTGYFRNRRSTKNITFPYSEYSSHIVLGVIYSRPIGVLKKENTVEEVNIEQVQDSFEVKAPGTYSVSELEDIPSVAKDFIFFAQPKFCVAKDQPGSGNTKNIGAVDNLSALVSGNGSFSNLGEEVFDDYWMYYLTSDMARAVELEKPPYRNLETYFQYKQRPVSI